MSSELFLIVGITPPVTCRKGITGDANGKKPDKHQTWPKRWWPAPSGLSEQACYAKLLFPFKFSTMSCNINKRIPIAIEKIVCKCPLWHFVHQLTANVAL